MATHESAKKRARQNEVRRVRNKAYKTKVKSAVKDVMAAVDGNAAEGAGESLDKAVSVIQMASSKGVIHRNKAARKISRLTKKVNRVGAA